VTKRYTTIFVLIAVLVITAFTGIGLVSLAGGDDGAVAIDNYESSSPSNKPAKVKLHLALKLLSGNWNEKQTAVILEGINHPTKAIEADVLANFSADDAKDVFYKIGGVDVSDLRTVYKTAFGKAAIVVDWTAERKANLWRQNFALAFVRYDLSIAQQRFLVDFAKALPITKEQSVAWDAEAATLFTRDVGRGIFTTIGDSRCPSGAVASLKRAVFLPTCVCTTNSGNWSCNDTCRTGTGMCNVDPGNCGVLWLWDCNGMCNNADEGN
jgi:hypothetical protein